MINLKVIRRIWNRIKQNKNDKNKIKLEKTQLYIANSINICFNKDVERRINMFTALNVASYVINEYHYKNKGISNLKLQKVLYYIQMKGLQDLGVVIFNDDIEAWRHGPVVREVYSNYKKYISDDIDPDDSCVKNNYRPISGDYASVIDDVVLRTLNLDPWEMVDKTHQTSPWKNNYRVSYNNVIPIEEIKKGNVNI